MAVSKKLKEQVRLKYDGLCAYTGLPLGDDWQVDHVLSKVKNDWIKQGYTCPNGIKSIENVDCIDNLLPALRIVNHYKRSLDLEGFRQYMLQFHIRLSKLPKKTLVHETVKRIEYMNKVATSFGITVEKPFSGIFYFETVKPL